jgi:hypothetical protein
MPQPGCAQLRGPGLAGSGGAAPPASAAPRWLWWSDSSRPAVDRRSRLEPRGGGGWGRRCCRGPLGRAGRRGSLVISTVRRQVREPARGGVLARPPGAGRWAWGGGGGGCGASWAAAGDGVPAMAGGAALWSPACLTSHVPTPASRLPCPAARHRRTNKAAPPRARRAEIDTPTPRPDTPDRGAPAAASRRPRNRLPLPSPPAPR